MTIEEYVKHLFLNDKDKAGAPYYGHCEFVGNMAKEIGVSLGLPKEDCLRLYRAGLLHDVLEDKSEETTEEEVLSYCDEETLRIVKLLTRRSGEDYEAYYQELKKDRLASIVKLADATHNATITRFPSLERTEKRVAKSQMYMDHVKELWGILLK